MTLASVPTPLSIARDVPLAPRTTLQLGGAAKALVEVTDEATLRAALVHARAHDLPIFPLGGGSNVVVSDAGFDGLVLSMTDATLSWTAPSRGRVVVTASAGVPWDTLVTEAVARGLAGVECLAGIPGSVGATPIQNVGAYGQEVADTIVEVTTVDRDSLLGRTRDRQACGFRYRDSIFKDPSMFDARGPREIVTQVRLSLATDGAPSIRYAELERAVAAKGVAPTVANVRDLVVALRRTKSMVLDDRDPNGRSAGSFFTNPIVEAAQVGRVIERAIARGVLTRADQMPQFPADQGRIKLAAAWLIERAGFTKGLRRGQVGISSNHALALVHHGGGTTRALLAFADEIVDGVRAAFDVTLTREPVVVGAIGA